MIQFNLLPDVKLEYVRSKRIKRSVFVSSFIVAASALTILVLMFIVVNVFQKQHLKDVSNDIVKYNNELKSKPDLAKILTVQNQLISLTCNSKEDFESKPCLHDKKPVASRMSVYMKKTLPKDVTLSELVVDFSAKTMNFKGSSNTLELINKFVDTLKFTKFKDNDGNSNNAFSGVVLTSFEKSEKSYNYVIDLSFNNQIFDSQVMESLSVPQNFVTTRSTLANPTKDLFKVQTKSANGVNNPQP